MRGARSRYTRASVSAGREIRHVLLYGTLCAGEPAHARFRLGESLTLAGRRVVPGTLYDLGPYPGLVLDGGSGHAELYRIDDASALARLDRYEGYDPRNPAASLFVRTRLHVARHAHSSAGRLAAWVYVYNGSVAGCPAIQGSWAAHRRG